MFLRGVSTSYSTAVADWLIVGSLRIKVLKHIVVSALLLLRIQVRHWSWFYKDRIQGAVFFQTTRLLGYITMVIFVIVNCIFYHIITMNWWYRNMSLTASITCIRTNAFCISCLRATLFFSVESVDRLMNETHELGGSTIAVDRATPKVLMRFKL